MAKLTHFDYATRASKTIADGTLYSFGYSKEKGVQTFTVTLLSSSGAENSTLQMSRDECEQLVAMMTNHLNETVSTAK